MTLLEAFRTVAVLPASPEEAFRRSGALRVVYLRMREISVRLARGWREPSEEWGDLLQRKALQFWEAGMAPTALACETDDAAEAYLVTALVNARRDQYRATRTETQYREDRLVARSTHTGESRVVDRIEQARDRGMEREAIRARQVAESLRVRAMDSGLTGRVREIVSERTPGLEPVLANELAALLERFCRVFLERVVPSETLWFLEGNPAATAEELVFHFVGLSCRGVMARHRHDVREEMVQTLASIVAIWTGGADTRAVVAELPVEPGDESLPLDTRFRKQRDRLYKRFERVRDRLLESIPEESAAASDVVLVADFLLGIVDLLKFRQTSEVSDGQNDGARPSSHENEEDADAAVRGEP